MSKKYNFGQLIGIFIGVTLGAVAVTYASNMLFPKARN